MDISIIYEDDELIVIDKPAGVVVNKSATAKQMTIQEWAEKRLGISFDPSTKGNEVQGGEYDIVAEFNSRGGVVHRLDKETSGILVIAKNPESFGNLKKQFQERDVEKNYIALTHGKIKPDIGEIDSPIGRLPWNRTHFGVLPEGRAATTHYKVLEYRKLILGSQVEELTLVELFPKTGRTHQIRVHLRHIGFPIFSDELYAGRKQSKKDRKILPRHFLHASKISIIHPSTGKKLEFESRLPSELEEFLTKTQPSTA